MQRIRKGDDVVVIAGRDKGKRGSVLRVMADGRLVVADVNIVKRHTKPNPNRGISGGIIEKEMPIDPSNVMLFNPHTSTGDRIGFRRLEDGRKVRYFKSTNEVVDV
jgi:large subunit ribosomal protein L24